MTAGSPIVTLPATADHLARLVHDEADFVRTYGLELAPGYVSFEGALQHALDSLRQGVPPQWSTHLFVLAEKRTVIGIGGFAGPPRDGTVEIGYEIAPDYRGLGYATAAAGQLIVSAQRSGEVHTVIAHTLADPGPSAAVLEKLGFHQAAELLDPTDGPILRWQRSVLPTQQTDATT
jgi:RimJ/RimL family protein N-acetyltransferase